MFKGFKDFLLRGNVIDLAVAFVIGAAFTKVVDVFAKDFIGGLLGVIGGTPNFGEIGPELNGSKIIIGTTLTALISFLITAAIVYFVLVAPVNRIMAARQRGEEPAAEHTPEDIALLQEIRDILRARGGIT
jgi:large conductance mechanosensitive channel